MSDPPTVPNPRELVIMSAEFTADELSEILLQLGYARQAHARQIEQYTRWYNATRDPAILESLNRARSRADNCHHVQDKTETVLMRKVSEHARTEATTDRADQHRLNAPGDGGLPEGPGDSIGFH